MSGVQAILTLPTICVHKINVSQVPLQAVYGRLGQCEFARSFMTAFSRIAECV
jgi:hypothetical protein